MNNPLRGKMMAAAAGASSASQSSGSGSSSGVSAVAMMARRIDAGSAKSVTAAPTVVMRSSVGTAAASGIVNVNRSNSANHHPTGPVSAITGHPPHAIVEVQKPLEGIHRAAGFDQSIRRTSIDSSDVRPLVPLKLGTSALGVSHFRATSDTVDSRAHATTEAFFASPMDEQPEYYEVANRSDSVNAQAPSQSSHAHRRATPHISADAAATVLLQHAESRAGGTSAGAAYAAARGASQSSAARSSQLKLDNGAKAAATVDFSSTAKTHRPGGDNKPHN